MYGLTEKSLDLFKSLVEDAPNWSGTPLFQGSKADTGNLTDLKVKGLVETIEDRGDAFVVFTDLGRELAGELGFDPQYLT